MEVKKKKYMSGKDLYMEILYSKAKGKLTPRAANMLMLLGKKLQSKMYYKDIDDKYDNLLRMLRQAKGGAASTTSLISNQSNFLMR